MTVAELIEQLKELPLDSEVIMQRDAEGNGYSPLHAVDGDAIYQKQTEWSGEVISTDWSWQDACFESADDWQIFKDTNPRCCVLAPTN